MNWKPGDMAIVLPNEGELSGGQVVKLVRFLGDWVGRNKVLNAWEVDYNYEPFAANECYLQPLPPQEKGSWDDCVWQPKELVSLPVSDQRLTAEYES